MARKLIIGVLVVAVLALLVRVFAFGPSDSELIKESLKRSTEAARRGEASAVMDRLSRSLSYNESPVGDRNDIVKVIRLSKPEVTLGDVNPKIDGNTAVVTTSAHVKIEYSALNMNQDIPKVTIKLQKETSFKYLIVPTPKWRITEVTIDEFANPQLSL